MAAGVSLLVISLLSWGGVSVEPGSDYRISRTNIDSSGGVATLSSTNYQLTASVGSSVAGIPVEGTYGLDVGYVLAVDSDGDGLADIEDNCPLVSNPDQLDTDSDGQADACDTDDDNDGLDDDTDNCPLFMNAGQEDVDGDGVGDHCDVCLHLANGANEGNQVDTDGDGLGNACDVDDDNDGLPDSVEDLNGNSVVDVGETDPLNATDAVEDPDGDGSTHLDDYLAISATTEYSFERMVPTLEQPWYFDQPIDIVTDEEGLVYVLDNSRDQVKVLGPDGQLVATWAERVSGIGIAYDGKGFLYVSNNLPSPVSKFDKDGALETSWGGHGSGPGEFGPSGGAFGVTGGVASDRAGHIFVADPYNGRVQIFNEQGGYLMELGPFVWPTDVEVDRSGNVFVYDLGVGGVYRATIDWSSLQVESEVTWPNIVRSFTELDYGITVDSQGFVYIAGQDAAYDNFIFKLDQTGQVEASWALSAPAGLWASEDGALYVPMFGGVSTLPGIVKQDLNGLTLSEWRSAGDDETRFNSPGSIAIDVDGSVYVAEHERIKKYDAEGRHVTSFDIPFTSVTPVDVTVDGRGYIYLAHSTWGEVRKYTTDGVFVKSWNVSDARHIAADGNGNIVVGTTRPDTIMVFTDDGQLLRTINAESIDTGNFRDIVVSRRGYIYALFGNSIWRFSLGLDQIPSSYWWGNHGDMRHMAIDQYDNIYAANYALGATDPSKGQIRKFSIGGVDATGAEQGGVLLGQFAPYGEGAGQVRGNAALAVGPDQSLQLVEQETHRLQKLRPITTSFDSKAIIIAGGGPYAGNHLWNATRAMANKAYRALVHQGFNRESIYYISDDANLDLDGNGLADDVDGPADIATVQAAFAWAGEDADMDGNSDAKSVIVYLADHGGVDDFRLNANDLLEKTELSGLLDTLETDITDEAGIPFESVVILDACQSGSFDDMANPDRLVISSAASDESAYFTGNGQMSFSSYFWGAFLNGDTIGDAFAAAQGAMVATPFAQTPSISAAAGSLKIGNATDNYIEGPAFCTQEPCTPQISVDVPSGSTGIITADNVTDNDGVNRVWAILHTPDAEPADPENPIIDLPTVELVEDDAVPGKYTATHSGFTTLGVYTLAISAMDNLGNSSAPHLTNVYVGSPLTRRAVLVVAGEATDSNWSAKQHMGTAVYDALRAQGYVDADITYLSATTVNGPEQSNTLNKLSVALADASVPNTTQDLTLYMIGASDGDTFTLNGTESISAATLDGWLDTLITAIPGKLSVVMDADNAGFYLERLDLTAASGGEDFYRLASTIRGTAHFEGNGSVSYTQYFAGNVANGARLPIAHLLAKQAMRAASSGQQIAWLDSNSDDTSDKFDISRIINYSLGPGILLAGDDPVIGNAGVDGFDALADSMDVVLWVDNITTTGTLDEVYALVTPPDTDGFGGVDPVPVKVPLTEVEARYESAYNLPSPLGGTYTVTFYAQDTDGAVSLPWTESLTRKDGFEIDDTEGQAKPITVDAPSQYHSFHAVIYPDDDKDWVTFLATSDTTYTITADPVWADADVVLTVMEDGGSPVIIDDLVAGDHPLGAEEYTFTPTSTDVYKVKVSLDTSQNNVPSDYTLAVTTNGGGLATNSVAGQVRDPAGNPVLLAFVEIQGTNEPPAYTTGGKDTATLEYNGDYSIGDDSGTYTLTALKCGYETFVDPDDVMITADGEVIRNITLTPQATPHDCDDDGKQSDIDNCPYISNVGQEDNETDGLGDACDLDDDNDGLSDTQEGTLGTDPLNPDTDGDGFGDGDDAFPLYSSESVDTDGDGIGNNADLDDDDDGFTDVEEIAAGTDPLDRSLFPVVHRFEFNAEVTAVSAQQNVPQTIYIGQVFNGHVDMDTSLAPPASVLGNGGNYDMGPATQDWIAEEVTLGGVTYSTTNFSATSGNVSIGDDHPSTSDPDTYSINSIFDNDASGQFAIDTSLVGDQMQSLPDFITGYGLDQGFIWNLDPDNPTPPTGTFAYSDGVTESSTNVSISFKLLRAQVGPARPFMEVDLSGTVKTTAGQDICAMVLASGQYMFSCDPGAEFSLSDLPRRSDGAVKRQIYADGFFPKKNVLMGPAADEAVVMTRSGVCPSYNTPYSPGVYPGSAGQWIDISGNVLVQDTQTPICAMVLASGQHMFSCDGTGSYDFSIPLNTDGQFKLQVYADGFAPTIQKFDEFSTDNTVRMSRAAECQAP